MQLEDITVQVRNASLGKVGEIPYEDLVDLQLIKRANNVGSWSISLVAEHPMATELIKPGFGILVTGPANRVLMSGSMVSYSHDEDSDDPEGTIKFQGADDNIHLADALAWPEPTNSDASTQAAAYDVRSGDAESVLRAYVSLNIGDGSTRTPAVSWGTASRLIPGLGFQLVNAHQGATVTGRARFDQLGLLCSQIASVGGVGFDIVQQGLVKEFQVYTPADKTGEIRMDIANDMLDSIKHGIGAPRATRAIVAGQGEGVDRTFVKVTDATAAASEAAWVRKIEVFKDRRDTDDNAELTQEGTDVVAVNGGITKSLSAVPSNEIPYQEYGVDWFLGDIVTVVVDGQELSAIVTEAIITITEDGVSVGVTIGAAIGFDYESKLAAVQEAHEKRLAFLEQNAEAADMAVMTVGQAIVGGTDLDSLILTGQYHQQTAGNATLALHYPVASVGGMLIVEVGTSFIAQTYYTRPAQGGLVYQRSKHSTNAWGSWNELTNLAYTGSNRPAFQAVGTGTAVKSGTSSYSILVLGTELFDQTGSYDASTGRFTAPVAGLYQFTYSTAVTTSVGGPELSLYKNGSLLYGNTAIGYGAAYNTFGNTSLVQLAAGDIVDVRWQNNNTTSCTLDLTRSYFSGNYIG